MTKEQEEQSVRLMEKYEFDEEMSVSKEQSRFIALILGIAYELSDEEIAKYMDKEYKDVVENTAYHTLTYLREKLNIDNEFIKGWKDGLIGGREVYYVGVLNAEPYMEHVNPMTFSYD